MNKEFTFHKLTNEGMAQAKAIADLFDSLLDQLKHYCPEGREFSLVKTKLEEACFFAKKAMANVSENQEHEG